MDCLSCVFDLQAGGLRVSQATDEDPTLADMQIFPGQRWISNTEAELGLGIIGEVSNRRVEVDFPAVDEIRTYAVDNAPLSRILFVEGDEVRDELGDRFVVLSAVENQHCMIYQCRSESGETVVLPEQDLGSAVHFTKPLQRLFAGQIDRHSYYKLRVQTFDHLHRLEQSAMRGFLGARIDLLPHQLHVAHQLSQSSYPRALLADEVGLGKTIEAGLIIHQRLITERDKRVLILVPENLQHQWLVEMLRRFNLRFSLLNRERFESAKEEGSARLFEEHQLVICSLPLLTHEPELMQQALRADWDLLVVDEAHHLGWSREKPSHAYQSVEQFCEAIPSVLLLTATPEHLGPEGHFARLRLLDPQRFHSIERYLEERAAYHELSEKLLQLEALGDQEAKNDKQSVSDLRSWLGEGPVEAWLTETDKVQSERQFKQLIDLLVAVQGPGKMMYRNTRESVPGFVGRRLHAYPLDSDIPIESSGNESLIEIQDPFVLYGTDWLAIDPRVAWLEEWLAENSKRKALLICSSSETADELENYLSLRVGVRTAAFHERMSLIQRDRAAAYFADPDQGAQLLIASEIGSEGRNFQFASDLILFDLPANPDLLEQRIGRLDRLGQKREVAIHVPYLVDTAAEFYLEWLDRGLEAFSRVSRVGDALFREFAPHLMELFGTPSDTGLENLIATTSARREDLEALARRGRDRLLELNSQPTDQDAALVDIMLDTEDTPGLRAYAEHLFDRFGLEMHPQGEHGWVVKPGEEMVAPLTTLSDEGLTLTFDRQEALHREEIAYLSWEHPLMLELVEWITHSEFGNTSVCTLNLPPLAPGTLLLEMHYRVRLSAPRYWQLDRFIDAPLYRYLIDPEGRDLAKALQHEPLTKLAKTLPLAASQKITRMVRKDIERAARQAEQCALDQTAALRTAALERFDQSLERRTSELSILVEQGSDSAQAEIDELTTLAQAQRKVLEQLELSSEAVRVILVGEK